MVHALHLLYGMGLRCNFFWAPGSINELDVDPAMAKSMTSLLSEEGGELTLVYGFGTQVSFEPDARRRWLIPTFGIDIGGLYGLTEKKRAHSFQFH